MRTIYDEVISTIGATSGISYLTGLFDDLTTMFLAACTMICTITTAVSLIIKLIRKLRIKRLPKKDDKDGNDYDF